MYKIVVIPVLLLSQLFITADVISQDSSLYKTNAGFIKFVSDAPLELITAESKDLRGVVDMAKRTFAFQLNVNTLKGFNSPLQQEHFYENYIETEQYPTAGFSGKIIENINLNDNSEQTVRAKGLLDIHGVKQERIIKCKLKPKDDKLLAEAEFIVPLADHNISIPQLVYQKIAEEIRVEVRVELTRIEN